MIDRQEPVASADVHIAVLDALLRFGVGTDDGEMALLRSAFAADAHVDFGPCGRKLGLDFPPLEGVDAIADFLCGTSEQQVTSHVVTNPRIEAADDRAQLRALVDATHVVRSDPSRRFRMMNWYVAGLEQSAGAWRIARMTIDNIWFEGDAGILMLRQGAAS